MFRSTTPPTLTSTALSYCKTATVLVPYEYYSDYFNSTNYHAYSNPMVGYGEFATGASLPAQLDGFNLVWYLNLDDLKNGTNSVTTCPEAGMLYAQATEIAS